MSKILARDSWLVYSMGLLPIS